MILKGEVIKAGGLRDVWNRFCQDPIGLLYRAWSKLIIGFVRYGCKCDYDAFRYWHDRYRRHGDSLLAPGDEGKSKEQNVIEYKTALAVFFDTCALEHIDFKSTSVLEIGYGTGVYAHSLYQEGVRDYVGIDFATAIPFWYSDFQFINNDITEMEIEGQFDLVMAIDVLQHIVNEEKLQRALRTMWGCVKPGGRMILGLPLRKKRRRDLFYRMFWTLEDIVGSLKGIGNGSNIGVRWAKLPDWHTDAKSSGLVPFREDESLLVIRKES